ncbi:AraC family transcriptional regulator [uncultured Croceitalea sp.]|uniref:helix-turn-helix transcriptional regulator n=1 Tax=uncultured Croceitalea sp. TaxID=1798908 RepID=UPI0033058E0A
MRDKFSYPIHFHPEIELNYISNGAGVRRIVGDHLEVIEDKELVLVGSNLYHCWENHNLANGGLHEITVQFHYDLFEKTFLDRAVMRPIKDMLIRSRHGIAFSRETILAIEPRLVKVSKRNGMDYFLELFSILYDLAISRNQRLLTNPVLQNDSSRNNEKLQVISDYVQKNYHHKITLSEVAEATNMSQITFSRFIRRAIDKTFVEYLNDVRVGHASKWLIEKNDSISEIAYNCGFNSIANFNRKFKKSKGCTPSEYRRDFLGIKRAL